MKRMLTILLTAALLFGVTGCAGQDDREGQVAFYYKRAQLSYGEQSGVIAAEHRHLEVQDSAMLDILNQYVDGPHMSELTNVFPLGCEVLAFSVDEDVATVHFNKTFGQLQDISQTLACVCMSRTVMEMTGVRRVRISAKDLKLGSGDYLEFDENSVFYFDESN